VFCFKKASKKETLTEIRVFLGFEAAKIRILFEIVSFYQKIILAPTVCVPLKV